jgi:hypothetical protein
MKTFTCLLLAAAAACTTASPASRPEISPPRLSQTRNFVKPGMPAPLALGLAEGLLGPPTLVDADGTRWMMSSGERCTELRVVAGKGEVRGVTLFSVTQVAGAQYKTCMGALGLPVAQPELDLDALGGGGPPKSCLTPS